MNHVASWIAFVGLVVAVLACNKAFTDTSTNYNLPLVHAALPSAFLTPPEFLPMPP